MKFDRLEIWGLDSQERDVLLRTLTGVDVRGTDDNGWEAKGNEGEATFKTWGDYPCTINSDHLVIQDGHLQGQDAPNSENSSGEWRLFTKSPSPS